MHVTIVGAGIIGCALAHELASRGAVVRLIDRRGAGQGATRASAGMLAPYIEGHRDDLLRLGVCSLALYDRFIERVRHDSGLDVEYRRCGSLQVAGNDAEAAALDTIAHRLSEAGAAVSLLGPDQVSASEPLLHPAIVRALSVPQHGYVVATGLVAALRLAAERLGTTMVTSDVRAIAAHGSGIRLETDNGVLDSDVAVIAAGSWSSALVQPQTATQPAVRPIRGQLVQLRFPQPPLSTVVWGTSCYLVPWADGSLLVGATSEDVGFDESSTAAGVRQLLTAAAALLPSAEGAGFHDVRAGLRPATGDELPLLGPSSSIPGVFYATGHYRSGVLLAPLTAKVMADLIMGGRENRLLADLHPSRAGW